MQKYFSYLIIIPAFNEEKYIGKCLESLVAQNFKPEKIIVVDDSSTDRTASVVKQYEKKYPFVKYIKKSSTPIHQPGSKVIKAFNYGLSYVDTDDYDVICKFDADLEFPETYIETLNLEFTRKPKLGLLGGICSIQEGESWKVEALTNLDHVRGALKAYRKKAYIDIFGLDPQMGWDTADEFKLRYQGWLVKVDSNLVVKHHKPTAIAYKDEFYQKQGEVFFALRYGFVLTFIAAMKLALKRKQFLKYKIVLNAYKSAKNSKLSYVLSKEEGKFIRKYRWQHIFKKLIS